MQDTNRVNVKNENDKLMPINLISSDQLVMLDVLNSEKVKYLAFGEFSQNSYEKARKIDRIKFWIEPSDQNIAKLNKGLKSLLLNQVLYSQELDPNNNKPLSVLSGQTHKQMGVEFYPRAEGIEDFDKAYGNKVSVKAVYNGYGADRWPKGNEISVNHMSLPDLYKNVASSKTFMRDNNLDILYNCHEKYNPNLPKLPHPKTYLGMVETNPNSISSETESKNHIDETKRDKPLVKIGGKEVTRTNMENRTDTKKDENFDFNKIRKALDLVLISESYGFKNLGSGKFEQVSNLTGEVTSINISADSKRAYKTFTMDGDSKPRDVISLIHEMEGKKWPETFVKINELAKASKLDPDSLKHGSFVKEERPTNLMDLKLVAQELDLEVVLKHYNYDLSKKSKPTDPWRIYKPAGDSESRISVKDNPNGVKGFVDLNNRDFYGNVVNFIHKMENDNWPRTFKVINEFILNPELVRKHKFDINTPAIKSTPTVFKHDEKAREDFLVKEYNLVYLNNRPSNYLNNRSLEAGVYHSPEFQSKIFDVRRDDQKFHNVGFPLESQKGNILSIDIRNVNYKSFPEGEKSEGIFKSNPYVRLLSGIVVADGNGKQVSIPEGVVGTLSKRGFHYDPINNSEDNNEKFKDLSKTVVVSSDQRAKFERQQFNKIILLESPIDALSLRQLSPPSSGEFRQYISTAGNPGKQQVEHISKEIRENPKAQIVLAMDPDNPGLRYAINYLSLSQPIQNKNQTINSYIAYTDYRNNDKNTDGVANIGHNLLHLEVGTKGKFTDLEDIKSKNEKIIDRVVNAINHLEPKSSPSRANEENGRKTLYDPETNSVQTSAKIKFPNDSKQIIAALTQLTKEINGITKPNLFHVLRPDANQGDFNSILSSRKGQPFSKDDQLSLSNIPALKLPEVDPNIRQQKSSPKL